jgi:hypothetical protein
VWFRGICKSVDNSTRLAPSEAVRFLIENQSNLEGKREVSTVRANKVTEYHQMILCQRLLSPATTVMAYLSREMKEYVEVLQMDKLEHRVMLDKGREPTAH